MVSAVVVHTDMPRAGLACRAGVCMFRVTFEEAFGVRPQHTRRERTTMLASWKCGVVRGCDGRARCCMDEMATHCGGEVGQHVLKERLLFLQIAGDGGVPAPHVLSQFDPCGGVPRIIGDATSQRLHGGVPGRTAGPASGVQRRGLAVVSGATDLPFSLSDVCDCQTFTSVTVCIKGSRP